VYRCISVDEAVEEFTRSLTGILDRSEMAPVKRFQSRHHYASWLSEDTKCLMTSRDEAMTRYSRTQLPEDWETARMLRNQVTRRLKTEKCSDVRRRIRNCEEEQDSGPSGRTFVHTLAGAAPVRRVSSSPPPAPWPSSRTASMVKMVRRYVLSCRGRVIQLPHCVSLWNHALTLALPASL
jgi:hypothetical protein